MATLPLENCRIVITRAEEQAESLVARLRELGAIPLLHPAIAFAPPDDPRPLHDAIRHLGDYDWLLLTSANAVRALFERMDMLGVATHMVRHVKIGVVGPATAAALAERGLRADVMPSQHVAEALAEAVDAPEGKRMLFPSADLAREALADALRERGAQVDVVVAYRTVPGPGAASLAPLLRNGMVDAITFTSSSTVRYLLEGLEHAGLAGDEARTLLNAAGIICIGPVTARTAHEQGLHVAAEAAESTADGLVNSLVAWFQQKVTQKHT